MFNPILARVLGGFAAALVLAGAVRADERHEPSARALLKAARITPEDGVDTRGWVRIGGIDQWIQVRGRHRSAPILLFLHGGPGFTSIPTSWAFMSGWEEYFTVVQWDQRGAGRTFEATPPDQVRPTMTIDRMVADAEEVVEHLRRTYGRRKIVLVAHSWGTVLGLKLAQKHPDWFYAYVSMGQMVDFKRSEALGYQATLAAARAAGDSQVVSQLEALAPYPDPARPERNLKNLPTERQWLTHYHGEVWRGDGGALNDLGRLSPDYTDEDLKARDAGLDFSLETLWGQLSGVDFSKDGRFACPVVFLHGRHDLSTNAEVFADWYGRVQAPSKRVVWLPDAAHDLFEEAPGQVLATLVDDVLPLAS